VRVLYVGVVVVCVDGVDIAWCVQHPCWTTSNASRSPTCCLRLSRHRHRRRRQRQARAVRQMILLKTVCAISCVEPNRKRTQASSLTSTTTASNGMRGFFAQSALGATTPTTAATANTLNGACVRAGNMVSHARCSNTNNVTKRRSVADVHVRTDAALLRSRPRAAPYIRAHTARLRSVLARGDVVSRACAGRARVCQRGARP
jgi:hypothetical protein